MIEFSLSAAAEKLSARHIGPEGCFSAVSTDSRTIAAGDLFVALVGPNFDGHDYLDLAAERGSSGAMVQRAVMTELPLLQVDNTLEGLGQLAAMWRQRAEALLVAITGSNGKTTVKEMLASILRCRGEVLATEGNLNNEIGMPLTLLRLQEQSYAVVEMGANHIGEIDYLSRIAQPDVALLTNAGRAHLEGFGSLERVARAKGEIINGLTDDGCFIFNADDHWAPLWRQMAGERKYRTFGVTQPADVSSPEEAWDIVWEGSGFFSRFPVSTPEGDLEIKLPLAGRHNRMNALAAITAAQVMGADLNQIVSGLESLQPVKGRLYPMVGRNGVQLVDDSYNANPDSVAAAIEVLVTAPGRRFLVLGELAEMGEGGELFYRELGELARSSGIEHLYAVGHAVVAADAFGEGGCGFSGRDELIEGLLQVLKPEDCVLVKGSRRAGMEQIINRLIVGID
ncbi:MAG: UDP-N-acetylmuramoyl-tripeptide--D-alanyl-D-alanine ligase [Sedimenticola sp.]